MTITKRNPDSEFWQIVARGAREAEGYPDWKRGAMLKPATKVRTTITIPVTHIARIAVQQPYPALEVDYGRNGVTANEQSWHDQGQVNHECRTFAVRRQRGFT